MAIGKNPSKNILSFHRSSLRGGRVRTTFVTEMSDEELPSWARLGRARWQHTGASRPSFAIVPGPGQESVWDYPRPPSLLAEPRRVRVALDGVQIADTLGAMRVLETAHPPTFYLPRADVEEQFLHTTTRSSRCEWKGHATLYDVHVNAVRVRPAARSYEEPFPEFAAIAGYIAFYAAPFVCSVGGAPVRPQGGGFYGGWITPELVGPFKGDPGITG